MERPYHVVVWGATGFVGKLVCEHIARDYQARITSCLWQALARAHGRTVANAETACPLQAQGKFRWAMVARNKARLEGVHREMVNINSEMKARSNCATA